MEEHDSELRGMVGDLQEDVHAAEVGEESRRADRRALPSTLRRETARRDHEVGHRPLPEPSADADDRKPGTQEPAPRIGKHGSARTRSAPVDLRGAIDEGYDIRNPFRGIKRGKDKPRTRVLTLDEETKLLDALHPRFQRFVRFALGTGCRLDEIRGIDPKQDIDWLRSTVHVIGKFRKERDVPMQPDANAALKEQLEEEGKLWRQNPQRLREVLAEGSARAKIPSLTPHALRHTFGTRWLQAGGDIYKLSKILGHSSVAVTEAHYAHLLKEDLVAASQQVRIPIAPRESGNVVRMPGRGRGSA